MSSVEEKKAGAKLIDDDQLGQVYGGASNNNTEAVYLCNCHGKGVVTRMCRLYCSVTGKELFEGDIKPAK